LFLFDKLRCDSNLAGMNIHKFLECMAKLNNIVNKNNEFF